MQITYRHRFCAAALVPVLVVPAGFVNAGTIADSLGSFKIAADLSRRSSQEAAVKQAVAILTSVIPTLPDPDGDPFPEPPGYLAGGGPAGGGLIPPGYGAPDSDGYGSKLGYCAWDNGAVYTAGANRLQGSTTDLGAPVFAVISSGLDGVFNRTCAQYGSGATATDDDFVIRVSTLQVRQGVGGTVFYGDPIATTALLNATPGLKNGELRLVLADNSLWRWDASGAGAWVSAANSYVASAVNITGGSINGTVIGNSNPASGAFTTLSGALTGNVVGNLTGNVSGNATSASRLLAPVSIAMTGDATWSVSFDGSANVSAVATLSGTGVAAGTYGSATTVPIYAVNAAGRLTASSAALITPAWTSITGTPTTLAGYGISDANPAFTGDVTKALNGTVTTLSTTGVGAASYGSATSTPIFTVDAKGRLTAANAVTITPAWGSITGTPTTLAGYGISDANPAYTGDVTKALNGTVLTLAASGVTAASYGSATSAPTFTVDAKGRLTAANAVTITPAWGSITGTPTTLAGYGISDANPAYTGDVTKALNGTVLTLATSGVTAASYGSATTAPTFTVDTKGRLTAANSVTITPAWASITGTPTTLAGYGISDANPAYTGDVTKALNGTVLTLAASGVTAGSYGSATSAPTFTVDAKGRLTAANSVTITPAWASITGTPTTLAGYGISDANPAYTGDVTKALNGTVLTLAASGVTAASYGSATSAPTFTVDAKGRLTAANAVTITPAWGSITGTPTTLAGYGISDANPAYTGDVTKALNGTVQTLAASGVTAGTYGSATSAATFTVDAKGRLTAANAVPITPAWTTITGTPSTGTGYGIISIDTISIGATTPASGAFTTLSATSGLTVTGGNLVLGSGNISGTLATRPAFGVANRIYIATDTNEIYRDTGAAWNKIASGSGATSLSALTAATAANTTANGANAQSWNWALTGNTTGFAIGETTAATGGTGTQYLQTIGTLAGSTAVPLSVSVRGTEAFRVDSVNPQLVANGGTLAAPAYAFAGNQSTGLYIPAAGQLGASVAGARGIWLTAGSTSVGKGALALDTSATATAVGTSALAANVSGANSTAVGYLALTLSTGDFNTAVGSQALASVVTGIKNVAVGTFALNKNTGSYNNAMGYNALNSNTTGNFNTAVGNSSLAGNKGGLSNVAIGSSALLNNVGGDNNTAVGSSALINSTTSDNAAFGESSLKNMTTGTANSAFGKYAGLTSANNITGSNLTFLGYNATIADTAAMAGSGSITLVGAGSSASGLGSATPAAYMTALGAGATVTTINTVVLGRTTDNVAVGQTGAGAYQFTVNGTAGGTSAYAVSSDQRFKMNITPVINAIGTIKRLEGVHYEFNRAAFPEKKFEEGRQLGFIAQQIEPFIPEIVRTDRFGFKSVQYSQLVPLLAEGIKEQQLVLQYLVKKDPTTLLVDIKTFQANDAVFENIKSTNLKTANLEADNARIKKLEAERIEAKYIRADVVKSGEAEVFVSLGSFQPLFVPLQNSQYIVNATAEDGSSAFASVAFMAGKITVTPISGKGVDVTAMGTQIGLVAPSKKIKATWIRMS